MHYVAFDSAVALNLITEVISARAPPAHTHMHFIYMYNVHVANVFIDFPTSWNKAFDEPFNTGIPNELNVKSYHLLRHCAFRLLLDPLSALLF
jgi:hypothetical protein